MLRINPLVNLKRIRKPFESLHEKVLVLRLQLSFRVSGNSRVVCACVLVQESLDAFQLKSTRASPCLPLGTLAGRIDGKTKFAMFAK